MPAERYFTGKPCKRGHISERWVKTKICIECAGELRARFRRENPDKVRGYNRVNGLRHRIAHPEEERRRAARWRADNPEEAKATVIRWRRKNPDKWCAKASRRRARKAGSGGAYTAQDVLELIEEQGGKCVYCPTILVKGGRHTDHIMPLALGGSNDRSNIQILCAPCNLSKGSKHPSVFASLREGQIQCIQ